MAVDNQTREYAIKFATTRFDRAAKYWEEQLFSRMRDWDDYYNVKLPSDLVEMLSSDDQSDLVPPDIHFLTNDFRASIVVPFQRAGRVARIRGIGPRDIKNEAPSQAVLDWNIETTDYWNEFDKDMYNVALAGYAVGILEERPMFLRTVKNGKIVEEEMFGGGKLPFYRHLDRYKVYFDPRAVKPGYPHCRYICYQAYMTREEILHERAQDKSWDFDPDDLRKHVGELTKDERAVANARGFPSADRRTYEPDEPIPVTHYIGAFHREGGEEHPEQVIMAFAEDTLLRFKRPTMDYPAVDAFHLMTLQPDDARLIGMGKVEPIEDLFLENYLKRNQRIDAVNTNAYGLNFIQRESEIPEVHRLGNMRFIQVDDPVAMQTFQGGDTGALFAESGLVRQEIRENYGSDYSLGVNPQQRESATGATLLIESRGKNTITAVRNLWYSGLRRHMQMRLAILQAKLPDEVYIRLTEDVTREPERIEKEHIAGRFDFSLALGIDDFTPDTVRQARVERLAAFYREDPDIDQYELKKLHVSANGFGQASLLVVSQDEKEQLPRTESAVIIRTGIQIPINDTDDDMLHYQVHIQALMAAMELADQGKVLAAHLATLQEHANQHADRARARYGTQTGEPSVLPSGGGKLKMRRPSESNEPAKIRETRSDAQIRAQQVAGPFQ